MSEARQVWLVLGASSAIARAFALAAATSGADIVLAGRDLADLEASAADIRLRTGRDVVAVPFDAGDLVGHADFVAEARRIADAATLNVFLAFGTMPPQSEIDAAPAEAAKVIMANYTGAVSVLHRLAPILEAQRQGRVLALASVAGDRGRIKNYVYGSAKAGLATYLQGLRARLFRAGVSVTTVKPGFVDTAMTFGLPGMFLVADPADIARSCLKAAERGKDVIYAPFFWWAIMTIIRHIPERIFKRLGV